MPRIRTDCIVLHCTATPEGQRHDVSSIIRMHRARKFTTIGFHYLIGLEGTIWPGRKLDDCIGAHVAGYNSTTLGVAYVGGLDRSGRPTDTRNAAQIAAMLKLCRGLLVEHPKARILAHHDLSPEKNHDGVITPNEWIKDCPCFSARTWAREVGLPAAPGEPGATLKVAADAEPFPHGTHA